VGAVAVFAILPHSLFKDGLTVALCEILHLTSSISEQKPLHWIATAVHPPSRPPESVIGFFATSRGKNIKKIAVLSYENRY